MKKVLINLKLDWWKKSCILCSENVAHTA